MEIVNAEDSGYHCAVVICRLRWLLDWRDLLSGVVLFHSQANQKSVVIIQPLGQAACSWPDHYSAIRRILQRADQPMIALNL